MQESEWCSRAYADEQDAADPLRDFRKKFWLPYKYDLERDALRHAGLLPSREPAIYLCGNSLGVQPVKTQTYMRQYLDTWAQKGVYGHFKDVPDTNLPQWLDVDDKIRANMAPIVGAQESEVAVMQTLTANLHLMMCSFYEPSKTRYKILIEGHAFPSDHFAVESQIRYHDLDPAEAMVLLEPESGAKLPILTTDHVLKVIDEHASKLALVLLPGIQYYTGQFFDIATITKHAQSKGVMVGWDLAHAVGNVPLQLHDWNVDFAVWCSYKYLNSGPGSIGGCFVHERHGRIESSNSSTQLSYQKRLAGWWGSQKNSRFAMDNRFEPIPGAAGWQLSNPSVADLTAVQASLEIFAEAGMVAIRKKSVKITAYLEDLLVELSKRQSVEFGESLFSVITPQDPTQRGAQLSVRLQPGLLDQVMEVLEKGGVVVDERRPDVVRVAPAPLYNSFHDVRSYILVFEDACRTARAKIGEHTKSVMVHGGEHSAGWSHVK